jgi:hypothetical protein
MFDRILASVLVVNAVLVVAMATAQLGGAL